MSDRASQIPRGIEVLVKKAAVDAEFHKLLLERRAEAAKEIGLVLDPAEAAMLASIPASLLEGIIARTTVSPISRAAFLGKAAAVMLAALGTDLAAAEGPPPPGGIAPDIPSQRERFVLFTEADYKGQARFAVLNTIAYDKRAAETAARNRLLRDAYVAAQKAWKGDEAYKDIAFPMPEPQLLQIERIGTFNRADQAEELLKFRQKELDKKTQAAAEAEQRRLESLTPEERAKEQKRAALLKAAQALFEKELQRLVAASQPPRPPVSRGVSMDRPPMPYGEPPTVTGIRP